MRSIETVGPCLRMARSAASSRRSRSASGGRPRRRGVALGLAAGLREERLGLGIPIVFLL
jgi:hypothetical protein